MSENFIHEQNPSTNNTLGTSFRPAETKSPSAFRTISEVAADLSVPQHVLRFWESKFQQIRPLKRGGGRRYYRPEDIQLISSIKDLLYNQGFTIRGAQKHLREVNRPASVARALAASSAAATEQQAPAISNGSSAPVSALTPPSSTPRGISPETRREIESVLSELKALREFLKQSGV